MTSKPYDWRTDEITRSQYDELFRLGYRGLDMPNNRYKASHLIDKNNQRIKLMKVLLSELDSLGYVGPKPENYKDAIKLIVVLHKLEPDSLGYDGPKPENSEGAKELILFLHKLKELDKLGYVGPKPTNSEDAIKLILFLDTLKKLDKLGYVGPKPTNYEDAIEKILDINLNKSIRSNEESKKKHNEKMDKTRDFTSF